MRQMWRLPVLIMIIPAEDNIVIEQMKFSGCGLEFDNELIIYEDDLLEYD